MIHKVNLAGQRDVRSGHRYVCQRRFAKTRSFTPSTETSPWRYEYLDLSRCLSRGDHPGSLVLPSGLYWSDEARLVMPVEQSTDRTLTGALVLEESLKTKGRRSPSRGQDGNQYTAWVALNEAFLGFSSLTALRSTLLVNAIRRTHSHPARRTDLPGCATPRWRW